MLEMREQKCAAGVLEMIEMNDCRRQELEDKGNKIEEQAASILGGSKGHAIIPLSMWASRCRKRA